MFTRFNVSKENVGKRTDVFIASMYPEFTRSSLSALFDKEMVKINGKTAGAASKLHSSDKIIIDETLLKQEPPEIELLVMYEDQDVIVINKPAGILTHSKGALNTEATVASFIAPKFNDQNLTGNRAGIVHRLDRATSGVILTAKNEKALKWLQKQFSTRKADKRYVAIVEGLPEPAEAIIDAPIERNPKKRQTFRVEVGGKPSQTKYKLLKVLNKSNNTYSLLELIPQTGRTHQLRVHLKYTGHPIVGDRIYGHGGEDLYLHASSLELVLPDGRKMKFEAPAPKIFKEFIRS